MYIVYIQLKNKFYCSFTMLYLETPFVSVCTLTICLKLFGGLGMGISRIIGDIDSQVSTVLCLVSNPLKTTLGRYPPLKNLFFLLVVLGLGVYP